MRTHYRSSQLSANTHGSEVSRTCVAGQYLASVLCGSEHLYGTALSVSDEFQMVTYSDESRLAKFEYDSNFEGACETSHLLVRLSLLILSCTYRSVTPLGSRCKRLD